MSRRSLNLQKKKNNITNKSKRKNNNYILTGGKESEIYTLFVKSINTNTPIEYLNLFEKIYTNDSSIISKMIHTILLSKLDFEIKCIRKCANITDSECLPNYELSSSEVFDILSSRIKDPKILEQYDTIITLMNNDKDAYMIDMIQMIVIIYNMYIYKDFVET